MSTSRSKNVKKSNTDVHKKADFSVTKGPIESRLKAAKSKEKRFYLSWAAKFFSI